MFDFCESLSRAVGASAAGGLLGARIGGSVTAVFGPGAVGGAGIGGLIGAVGGAAASLGSDLLD